MSYSHFTDKNSEIWAPGPKSVKFFSKKQWGSNYFVRLDPPIYTSFVRPYLEYANTVWSTSSETHKNGGKCSRTSQRVSRQNEAHELCRIIEEIGPVHFAAHTRHLRPIHSVSELQTHPSSKQDISIPIDEK